MFRQYQQYVISQILVSLGNHELYRCARFVDCRLRVLPIQGNTCRLLPLITVYLNPSTYSAPSVQGIPGKRREYIPVPSVFTNEILVLVL